MPSIHSIISKALLLTAAALLISLANIGQTNGAILGQRSITVGTPIAGSVTSHTFKFDITTAGNLGSIQFQYCDNDPFIGTPCTAPPGLVANTSTLGTQTGEIGFSIDPSSSANNIILTRVLTPALAGPVQYVLTGVTNPTTPNNSTYVRISTYASTDATGSVIDQGGVVFSTAGRFGTTVYIPPILYFCVGITVGSNCTSTTGDSINFGTLKPTQAVFSTSQSSAATNDPTGYVIYSLGTTMTSGNNVIPASITPNPSIAGISQFGINLRANSNPSVGQNISGLGSGSVMPNYSTSNLFMFDSGAAVAEATQATDFNVYTTTYVVNVALGQAPGIYVTTISYMAVAQF